MDCVRTILVANGHSDNARHAEMRAAMLGDELKAEIVELMTLTHARTGLSAPAALPTNATVVAGDNVALRETQAAMPALLRRDAEPGRGRTRPAGNTPAAIVERANEIGAGLTVVAANGKRFFSGLFAKYKNDELVRLSDRPVLLVNCEPEQPYRKVLVAVDFSAESREAARVALAVAPSAHFTFLHVFRVADEEMMLEHGVAIDTIHGYRIRAREEARVKLNSFIDGLGRRRQLISRSIEHGMPGTLIHAHAKEINADLIVVGKHGKSRLIDLFLGSVTQRLIDYGDIDLLVTTTPFVDEPDLPPAA